MSELCASRWHSGNLRRVRVSDLREVHDGAQRLARGAAAGSGGGSPRQSGELCERSGPGSAPASAIRGNVRERFWNEDRQEPPTGAEVAGIFCRVCGDCHFGPWGIDPKLGVLVCEGCEEAFDLLDQLSRTARFRFWTLVGAVQQLTTAAEIAGVSRACLVCKVVIAPELMHTVYRRGSDVDCRTCSSCAERVGYVARLGSLRGELVKAHARKTHT